MSSIIHKVKDAVTHKKSDDTHHTDNYESNKSTNNGPHDSNVANTADPRVDSDQSALNSRGHTAEPLSTGASHNAHDSSRSSNHGPHDSKVGNTVDPRVDSTRGVHGAEFTSQNVGSHAGATGSTGLNTGSHTGLVGSHAGSSGINTGSHTGSTGSTGLNTGSHVGSSGINTGSHTGSTGYGSGAPVGTGHSTYDSSKSSNFGPHDSNVGNTVDPRVDSDRTSRTGTTGLNTGSSGFNNASHTGSHSNSASYGSAAPLTGTNSANAHESARSSNHGPHGSNIANAADPRVDSDRSKQHDFNADVHKGSLAGEPEMMHLSGNSGPNTSTRTFEEAHQTGAAGTGAGSSYNSGRTSQSTAGPHSSNLANKADPRVDSDLDGSKTVGSTHQRI